MASEENDTCDTSPYNLGINDGYALLLNGSLGLTIEDLSCDAVEFNDVFFVQGNDTDRFQQVKIRDPQYYIKTAFDINSMVTMVPGDADDGNGAGEGSNPMNDDAWKLDKIVITGLGGVSANDTVTKYNLPGGNTNNFNIAVVTACDNNGDTSDFKLNFQLTATTGKADMDDATAYPPKLNVTANAWSGIDVSGSLTEDILKAQNAFWVNDASNAPGASGSTAVTTAETKGENDKDTLVATLTKQDVNDFHSAATAAAIAAYNDQTTIAQWTITIDAISNDTRSNLSAWARNNFSGNSFTPNDDPFQQNDAVVAATPDLYSVVLSDNEGTSHPVVSAATVYGVVYQS